MSFSFTIDLADGVSPALASVRDLLQRGDVRKVMGRAVADDARRYYTRLDQERPNEQGGRRTHFWAQVRRSVQQPELIGGDGVKIAINHVGLAQRYFGGDIVAGANGSGKKWLTLSARSETYGKRAGEFDDLHFVFFRADLAALVQNEQTSLGGRVRGSVSEKGRKKSETIGGGIFYWLKPKIHQEGDETALPPEAQIQQVAVKAADDYVSTLLAREGSS